MAKSKSKNSVTECRNYYLPMHFPVLLIAGDHWKISDIPSGRQHFHNCLEVGVCHSDSGHIEFLGQPLPFREGDVTVIPKNVPHTTYSTPGTESHWSYLFLDPRELFQNLLPATWSDFDLSTYAFQDFQPIFSREEYPQLYFLVMAIIRELEEQKPGYQLSAKGLLLAFYIAVVRILSANKAKTEEEAHSPKRQDTKWETDNSLVIAPALNYIETNYMQQFTIEQLANLCHWSPTHFRRVFHDIMGMPPLDFVNHTRISKACNLLRSTEETVLNISEMVGFHSVSSFNRYFFKIMQSAPREYRKQAKLSDTDTQSQTIMEYSGWMYPEK